MTAVDFLDDSAGTVGQELIHVGTFDTDSGVGDPYTGFDGITLLRATVTTHIQGSSRHTRALTVTVEQSEDGDTWETAHELEATGPGEQTFDIEAPPNYLRVSWEATPKKWWKDLRVHVAPALVNQDDGGVSQPDGSVIPVADTGATLDTETYDNTWSNSGKLRTLVIPASTVLEAVAIEGDEFPRIVMVNPGDGFYYGDGTIDPVTDGPAWWIDGPDENNRYAQTLEAGKDATQRVKIGDLDANAGYGFRFSGGIRIGAEGVATTTMTNVVGEPAIGGNVNDLAIRNDAPDVNHWIYRCTTAGAAGAAVWTPVGGLT